MAKHIHKCTSCQKYTLKEKCSGCGKEAVQPKPPKFTLDDKYSSYRIRAKKEELKARKLY